MKIFKTLDDLNLYCIKNNICRANSLEYTASYRKIAQHTDNTVHKFRAFNYVGKVGQVAIFSYNDSKYVIHSGDWVLFDCHIKHGCKSKDWMTFKIRAYEYRHNLQSYSNYV